MTKEIEELQKQLGILPFMDTVSGYTHDATEENKDRTYTHNGHTHQVSIPQLSDESVAHTIRMALRDDWHLEAKEVAARDRILCLISEKQELIKIAKQLRTLLAHCKNLQSYNRILTNGIVMRIPPALEETERVLSKYPEK